MSSTITIPARLVGHIHSGLHIQLASVGTALHDQALNPDSARPARWQCEPLARLECITALLDTIGWHPTDTPVAVAIDLAEHWWTLLDALDDELERHKGTLRQATGASNRSRRRRLQRRLRELREFKHTVEAHISAAGFDALAGAAPYTLPCPTHEPATSEYGREHTIATAYMAVSTRHIERAAA